MEWNVAQIMVFTKHGSLWNWDAIVLSFPTIKLFLQNSISILYGSTTVKYHNLKTKNSSYEIKISVSSSGSVVCSF